MAGFFKNVKRIFYLAVAVGIGIWLITVVADAKKAVEDSVTFTSAGEKILHLSDVKGGWLYTTRSTDGSGTIPLRRNDGGERGETMPAGVEFQVTGKDSINNRIRLTYEGNDYSIPVENIVADSGKKPAKVKMARTADKNIIDFLVFVFLVAFAGIIVYYKKTYPGKAKAAFQKYYDRKRKEFAWLDNWINQHTEDGGIVNARTEDLVSSGFTGVWLWTIIGAVVAILLSFFVPGKITGAVVSFLIMSLSLLNAYRISQKEISNPGTYANSNVYDSLLTLECPSCHCPHSWGVIDCFNVVNHKEIVTKKTTRKGYNNNDFVDSVLNGFKQDGTTSKTTVTYYGTSTKNYLCDNCKHTLNHQGEEEWGHEPIEGLQKFNPSKKVWDCGKK